MSFSKREQFLVFLMALLGIIILFLSVLILPLNSRINVLKTEKTTLTMQKSVIDSTIPTAPSLRSQQAAKVVEVNAELAKIESPLLSSEFERWILPLTSKYDMRVLGAKLSSPIVSTPTGHVVLINEPTYGLKTSIQSYTGELVQLDTTPETKATLLKSTYSYLLQTNYVRFIALLDDVSDWNTSFFVNKASYDFYTGEGELGIDAYTIHKISYVGDEEYFGDIIANGDNSSGGTGGSTGGTGGSIDDNGGDLIK